MVAFYPIFMNFLVCTILVTMLDSRPVFFPSKEQTPAQSRMWKPPIFPYWGPFGWHSSAILCPFMSYNPYSPYTARGCAGPMPPFTTPEPPPTTPNTTTTPPIVTTTSSTMPLPSSTTKKYYYYAQQLYEEEDYEEEGPEEDETEEQDNDDEYESDPLCS